MRFTSIIALCVAAVSAAPAVATTAESTIVASYVPKLEKLFAAVPQIDTELAAKFPALAKDGKVDTKVLMNLPGDLIGAGVDLVLGVPGLLANTAGALLSVPGDVIGVVDDIVNGDYYGGYDEYDY